MNLFSRCRKSDGKIHAHIHGNRGNNKSVIIGNKQGLFDDIIGFEDVKVLFEMAIKAERPVHLLLCGPPHFTSTEIDLATKTSGIVTITNANRVGLFVGVICIFLRTRLKKLSHFLGLSASKFLAIIA
jgi:hypothetical protein